MDAPAVKRSIGVEQAAIRVVLAYPVPHSTVLRSNPEAPTIVRRATDRPPAYVPGDRIEVSVDADPVAVAAALADLRALLGKQGENDERPGSD